MKFLHGNQNDLFSEKISSVTTSDGRVSKLVYDNARIKVKFNGDILKQK